ncbi:hypothetical protein GQX74_012615 [Glossina fuscipes]|nr:hypothetical protein GQX74_012615 [Glossina fuscipes]
MNSSSLSINNAVPSSLKLDSKLFMDEFKSINVSTSESNGSDLITLLCAYDWGDGVPQQFDSGGDGGNGGRRPLLFQFDISLSHWNAALLKVVHCGRITLILKQKD